MNVDKYYDIPDNKKIEFNRSLSSTKLLFYYSGFRKLIKSGCTKPHILHDVKLLKDEIKRRLNVYDKINDRFDKTNNDSVILIKDHWIEIDK